MFRHFQIENFRNISQATLRLSSGLNLIFGDNGAGKTSILEAMTFLARGQSHRTANISRIINDQSDYLQLLARLDNGGILGLKRSKNKMTARMNGSPVRKQSTLAECLPLYLISPSTHELIEGVPEFRRRFIDWGVFHVEHGYGDYMKDFRRLLKQRNSALQSKTPTSPWDPGLIRCVERIDEIRRAYVEYITPLLVTYYFRLTGVEDISLKYHSGWRGGDLYAEQLHLKRTIDSVRGYTSVGPQRADLEIKVKGAIARDYLSRGQQKMAVIALILAQATLSSRNKTPVLLIDDLTSELDEEHQVKLIQAIKETGCQTVFTSVGDNMLEKVDQARVFHVEHGEISRIE